MSTDKPEISDAERKRLERFERAMRNRRGRKQPSILPTDLARTSAFAPRRQGLVDDKNFRRVYTVTNQSVVEVTGRELGSQHRDALYALFRLRARRIEIPNPDRIDHRTAGAAPRKPKTVDVVYETRGTWRDLLRLMGRSEHVNNLGTLLRVLEEIREVTFRVYKGSYADYLKATAAGKLPSAGFSDNLLNVIEWDGVNLNSEILIRYGEWVKRMFEIKHLISLNSDVYFALKSDYAKSFWPYVDSQPCHSWIEEAVLADLAGRDIASETAERRRKFREDCRQAFDDMVRAGGLKEWTAEVVKLGRSRRYRYHYVHALPRQSELPLFEDMDLIAAE